MFAANLSERPSVRLPFRRCVLLASGSLALFCLAVHVRADEDLPPPADKEIKYEKDIKPLLKSRCYKCHGPEKKEGGLRLHRKVDALAGGDSGPVIVPGDSANSLLIKLVAGKGDNEKRMPPEGDKVSKEDLGLLRAWIDQGASFDES